MSETTITSMNCTSLKPSFGNSKVARLEETTELLRDIDVNKIKSGNLDEDTLDKIKDYVNGIEVDEKSKVQGPLKTLALSLLTLGTGMLITKGTANKFFYMLKDKQVVQKMFKKMGVYFAKLNRNIANKAKLNETAGAARKYFFKGLDYVSKKVAEFAAKGTTSAGVGKTLTAQAEKLTKATFNTVGALTGLVTTGAALSVDKDDNGRSDIIEGKNKENKRTQKAVIDFAEVLLDSAV